MRVEVALRVNAACRVAMSGWLNRLGRQWCRVVHPEITWPVNGYYFCRKCHRCFPVPWETPAARLAGVRARPRRTEDPTPVCTEAAA